MLSTSINGEPPPRNGSRTVRFGAFEADLHSGEVRKSGNRVKLQDQPFKVLQILLERPGDLVSREELQTRIWPEETYGDFDHAVNVAVGKLRNGPWGLRRQPILYRDGAPPWLSLCCPARARPGRGHLRRLRRRSWSPSPCSTPAAQVGDGRLAGLVVCGILLGLGAWLGRRTARSRPWTFSG